MTGRGKARYAYLASGSNNMVKQGAGTLYGLYGVLAAGGSIRVDDSHRFPQGVLNLNATSSNTIGYFGTGPTAVGLGFDTGLVVAFTSNTSGITVEYE